MQVSLLAQEADEVRGFIQENTHSLRSRFFLEPAIAGGAIWRWFPLCDGQLSG